MTVEFAVSGEDAGERLDRLLASRPEIVSRAAAQRLIDAGAVTIDGNAVTKRHRVSAGEHVRVEQQASAPPPVAEHPDIPIVFQDDHLMIVDKPAGLVVHPAPGHHGTTLSEILAGRAQGGESFRPGIVHRLDRDTSGLMVVAKTGEAHAALERAVRGRALEREYLALVAGRPDARRGTIDAPIGRDRRVRTRHSTRTDRPRSARTHFELERAFPRTTLLRVRLDTGRTHQIRVHLAAIGHPVCGDAEYGGTACGQRLGLTRQFLHSAELGFRHPITGEEVRCESNLPVDLRHASDVAAREPASEGPDGG